MSRLLIIGDTQRQLRNMVDFGVNNCTVLRDRSNALITALFQGIDEALQISMLQEFRVLPNIYQWFPPKYFSLSVLKKIRRPRLIPMLCNKMLRNNLNYDCVSLILAWQQLIDYRSLDNFGL